ncbi:MAG: linked oxidase domain protein [Frankiales bacterium]|nr:linked oxidase domain protein [Frankiales bacterium]
MTTVDPTPTPTTIDELRAAVTSGVVLSPGDEGFAAELAGFNLAHANDAGMVVGAASAADVAAAVRYAGAHGFPVGVQATGHGPCHTMAGALMVTTKRMQEFSVDAAAATATVQAGVRWAAVIEAAAAHGLAPLNGSSPGVSVVGYTTGGGLGPMARTFGWAADRVTSFEIVTADGQVRRVTAESDPDLFWAVRGGKGNFGIVTEMTFALVPVATLYGGGIMFPGAHAPELLHAWLDWSQTHGDETSTSISMLRVPDVEHVPPFMRGQFVVHLRVAHLGDEASGAALLAPMRAIAPALMDGVGVMPYAAVASIHMDPEGPLPGYDASVLLRELTHEAIDAILAAAGPGVDIPLIMAELRHMGGAVAAEHDGGSAIAGRDAAYNFALVAPCPPPLAAVVPGVCAGVLGALAPWSLGRSMVNFSGHRRTPAEVAELWSPEVFARLVDVKRRVDPANTFRLGASFGDS